MTIKKGIHCLVKGKVQGVWFRASTKTEAQRLQLTGWAKNLADGRVEVQAFGPVEQLEKLQAWLAQGPELAKVTQLECTDIPWQDVKNFEVR